jgi:hypothetical protein
VVLCIILWDPCNKGEEFSQYRLLRRPVFFFKGKHRLPLLLLLFLLLKMQDRKKAAIFSRAMVFNVLKYLYRASSPVLFSPFDTVCLHI